METLGFQLDLPLIGGYEKPGRSFQAAQLLQSCLELEWRRTTPNGFFFRAEDFSDFIKSVEREQSRIAGELEELKGNVQESVIREMSDGMNYHLNAMRRNYGSDMEGYSHGEAYLKILETRIGNKGIFILDEPEAALSPVKQLSLIFLILQKLKTGNTQFIISTHSPILMGIPNALIYEIREFGMDPVTFENTEHYLVTKQFLANPDAYLRYFEEE